MRTIITVIYINEYVSVTGKFKAFMKIQSAILQRVLPFNSFGKSSQLFNSYMKLLTRGIFHQEPTVAFVDIKAKLLSF